MRNIFKRKTPSPSPIRETYPNPSPTPIPKTEFINCVSYESDINQLPPLPEPPPPRLLKEGGTPPPIPAHAFSPEKLLRKINKHKKTRKNMRKFNPTNDGFINESNLEFQDISSEKKREYTFPNGNTLSINKPLFLNVSASGGHRLYAEDNTCYYIQPEKGWYIKWKSRKGMPHFVK